VHRADLARVAPRRHLNRWGTVTSRSSPHAAFRRPLYSDEDDEECDELFEDAGSHEGASSQEAGSQVNATDEQRPSGAGSGSPGGRAADSRPTPVGLLTGLSRDLEPRVADSAGLACCCGCCFLADHKRTLCHVECRSKRRRG